MPLRTEKFGEHVRISVFDSDRGASEVFAAAEPPSGLGFAESLGHLLESLKGIFERCAVSLDSLVFSRVYLQNVDAQQKELLSSDLFRHLAKGATSVVEQTPVDGKPLAIFLYFLSGPGVKKEQIQVSDEQWSNGTKIIGHSYQLLYAANLNSVGDDSFSQTKATFSSYLGLLDQHGLDFKENAVRTWIFIKDIEEHYAGMVEARKELFDEIGLNEHTYYIASTGIEGRLKEESTLVQMDALAIGGFESEQAINLEAPEYLCPTEDYGVTFERGTKMVFGDRSRFYISGTASIDKHGEIVHPEDPLMQTRRVLVNIRALLEPHGAGLRDLAHLIVYLKDFEQVDAIKQIIFEEVDAHLPISIVRGSICRPGWLVEIEGVAIADAVSSYSCYL